ncbi:MAG: NAD-dependent epimerase/dehydratase family protein [Nitrososphaerota archaeon]
MSTSQFRSIYKKINEMTARYFNAYRSETAALKYFNTYGIGENSRCNYSGVMWKFIEDNRNGKGPAIFGDGKQKGDFI